MSELLKGGGSVLGTPEGGAYFRPERVGISQEPRGHQRFISRVAITLAILLAASGIILTHNPISSRIETGIRSAANYFVTQDNIDFRASDNPDYRQNFADRSK